MTKKEVLLAARNGTLRGLYKQEVRRLVREVYDIEDEIAAMRQPEKAEKHDAYAEECKAKVKAFIESCGFQV